MWLYKGNSIIDLKDLGEPQPFGFVYRITNKDTGKFYIGKKQILSYTNVKLGKKELALLKEKRNAQGLRGPCPSKKLVIKEKKWVDYWGSNKDLLSDISESGKENFEKEILILCYNKKQLTYWEMAMQCNFNVLTSNSYNDNILGKFFSQDFIDPTLN